jgi:hypothetical protein
MMARTEQEGLTRSSKRKSVMVYWVDDRERLDHLINMSRLHNDNSGLSYFLYPKDYARPGWLKRREEEKPDALAVVEQTEDEVEEISKNALTEVCDHITMGTDEERWEAVAKVLMSLLVESRETFESAQKAEENTKSVSEKLDEGFSVKVHGLTAASESIALVLSKIAHVDKRLDRMEEKVGMTSERVGSMNKKLPEIEKLLAELIRVFNQLSSSTLGALGGMSFSLKEIVRNTDMASKLHTLKVELQTWSKLLTPVADQSRNSLAGIEAIMESVGRMEEEHGSGEHDR